MRNAPVRRRPNRLMAALQKYAGLISLISAAENKGSGVSGKLRGGFHLYAHSGATRTFKKNQRKERKLAAKRRRHR